MAYNPNETDTSFVNEMKRQIITCDRCGNRVSKYDNIGQWKCFEKRINPLTGEWYKLPSDHGSDKDMRDSNGYKVMKKPPIVMSFQRALLLPLMQAEAVKRKIITLPDGTVYDQVLILRTNEKLSIYNKNFALYGMGTC